MSEPNTPGEAAQDKPTASATTPEAAAAELQAVLGTARAAATEAEAHRTAASNAAAQSETSRTKASEHLLEIEAKRNAVNADADEVSKSAKSVTKKSAHIDDGVKFVDESRQKIEELKQQATATNNSIGQTQTAANEAAEKLAALLNELTEKRDQITPLNQEISNLKQAAISAKETVDSTRTETLSLRDRAKVDAAKVALHCQHVDEGKQYIDAERDAISKHTEEAKSRVDQIIASQAGAEAAAAAAAASQTKADELLAGVNEVVDSVKEEQSVAEKSRTEIERLASLAESVSNKVAEYQAQLEAFHQEFDRARDLVNQLVPGATAAGLAAGYHAQQGQYTRPRFWWNVVFFIALGGFAILGVAEIVHYWSQPVPEYKDLLRLVVLRWPLILALLWFALHAANRSRLASQIQEDYAHKEVLSRTFEGYRREFASVEEKHGPDSPLGALCSAVVSVIASNPSRVFDKHKGDPTPMTSVAEVSREVVSGLKEVKKPPGM